MALVPDRIWVTANYKENPLRDIRVGQPVELSIDALGGWVLTGKVEQIAPATGSEFSVIWPDNATGNFTKVAQRVPVRITLDAGQAGLDRYGRACRSWRGWIRVVRKTGKAEPW